MYVTYDMYVNVTYDMYVNQANYEIQKFILTFKCPNKMNDMMLSAYL